MAFGFLKGLVGKAKELAAAGLAKAKEVVSTVIEKVSDLLKEFSQGEVELRIYYDTPEAPIDKDSWGELTPLTGSPNMSTQYHQVYEALFYDPVAKQGVSWILTYASEEVASWDEIFSQATDELASYGEAQGLEFVGFQPVGIRERTE